MLYLSRNRVNGGARGFEEPFDRLLEEMTHGLALAPALATSEFEPTLDVAETDGEWRVKAELPGVAPEDVSISVTGNVLTISGEKKSEAKAEDEKFRRTERRYGKFVRSLEFPAALDGRKVEAKVRNGILVVTLPKAEESRPRTIEVKPA